MSGVHELKKSINPPLCFAIRLILCGCILSCGSAFAAGYDQPGPFQVKTLTFEDLKDPARNNWPVPLKVFYPQPGGPFPLIIMSHGAGGNWKSNIYQVKHLASHGYVVIAPKHIFSDTDRLIKAYLKANGGKRVLKATQALITDARAVIERPRDITFTIDRAILWNNEEGPLHGRIDAEHIGVAGHSFGAFTTLVICGARPILDHLEPKVDPAAIDPASLADGRVDACAAMSPQGPGSTWFNEESFKMVNRPMILFSGDKDKSIRSDGKLAGFEPGFEGFELMPPGDKYFLLLANAGHMGYSASSFLHKMRLRSSGPDQQRISKTMMLVFFNAYLKGDIDSKKFLNGEYANALTGRVVDKVAWYQK